MIKAVFFDVDGTLISFKTHTIPLSTVEALKLLRQKGVKIFVSTGRAPSDIIYLREHLFDGYITCNGSYCTQAKGPVIIKNCIPKNDVERLIQFLSINNNPFACAFVTEQGTFINRIDGIVKEISALVEVPLPDIVDLQEIDVSNVLQIDAYIDELTECKILREIMPGCASNRWHPMYTDLNMIGNTKGNAIRTIAGLYNFGSSEIAVFGDGGNDISMFNSCVHSVAMGNATDAVKCEARYITDSVDENGIWNGLLALGLLNGHLPIENETT